MNLIISDFDGTFYDNNYEENIKFIDSIRDKCDFVIATGRNYKSLNEDLKTTCKYYICNDGGYILSNDGLIYKDYMNKNEVEIVYQRLNELGYKEYFIDYIDHFDNIVKENVNKVSIKIKDDNAYEDMLYILKDLQNTYGYLSQNWINILPIESTKEKAIEHLLSITNYDNVYVIGNEINDYGMLKKYNGYLITDDESTEFNTIKSFLDLKDIIN